MTFARHVALLRAFLDRRDAIVEHIDARALSVPRNADDTRQILDGCFFGAAGLPRDLTRLNGQLEAAQADDGFMPIAFEGQVHELDPVDLVVTAHRHWDRHRRPGRNLRLRYAARVYAVFMLRKLERLSLRLWDDGNDAASDRLQDLQILLDRVNDDSSSDPLVRDVRWLTQTAQGALTRRLEPYFTVANHIAGSLTPQRRLDIHKAGAILTSGHLRSQLRHRAAETGRPIDHTDVLATTRNSNSLDGALLVRDLVPLLDAYAAACERFDGDARRNLADAILQGLSADPELFLLRLDLLGPCTMLEDLFLECGSDGAVRYSVTGETHREALGRYAALISRHAPSLHEDALTMDPRHRLYSPLGITYGFCADLLSHLAVEALLGQPPHGSSFEDMFASGGDMENKRARADEWRTLHERDLTRSHAGYSASWAEQIFSLTSDALRGRAENGDRPNATAFADARLFVGSAPHGVARAQEHCVTSDLQLALSTGATAFPRGQILIDRNEGRFLASAESNGKWFGISKVVLTQRTSRGEDALLSGVPPAVAEKLELTCPGLLAKTPG